MAETIDLTPDPESWPQLKAALEYGVAMHKLNLETLTKYLEEDLSIESPYVVIEAIEKAIGETEESIKKLEEELAQPWAQSVESRP